MCFISTGHTNKEYRHNDKHALLIIAKYYNNYNSNGKKLLGFRNLQEKLEKPEESREEKKET